MIPQDFLIWTRDDWKQFENFKQIAFQPTPEEIVQQEQQRKQMIVSNIQYILLQYKIYFTWDETDFSTLWTSYIKGWPDMIINYPMHEMLGDDNRLSEILQEKIENHNNFNDFTNFVFQYN